MILLESKGALSEIEHRTVKPDRTMVDLIYIDCTSQFRSFHRPPPSNFLQEDQKERYGVELEGFQNALEEVDSPGLA